MSDHTVLRPTISAFGNSDRSVARASVVAASNRVFDCPKSLLLPSMMMRSGWSAATERLTPSRVSAHWLGLPTTTNPASSQPRLVTSHSLVCAMTFGQASSGLSPQPLMIESPIVSTCRGAAGTTGAGGGDGAGGGTEGVAVGLGVSVPIPPTTEMEVGVGEASTPVDDECATAVENNTTTVMSPPAAMITATMAVARDNPRVGKAAIDLSLCHPDARSILGL